jgi:WXG100 family type VII secretion target
MAGEIRIDDATLYQAASDCRSAVESVRGESTKVRNAKDTVAARWHGGASNTFQGVIDAWITDAGKLMEAMNGIADLLDKTGKTHRANEEQQDQLFSKFNSVING